MTQPTAPSASLQAPNWVGFPIHALPQTDWTDHGQTHRAVMRLYPTTLPGARNERRATSGILYRLDTQPDGTTLCLIQSQHAVELLPPPARSMTVAASAWNIPANQDIMFRVAVSPITRRTVKEPGTTRRVVTATLPLDGVLPWLTDRLAAAVEVTSLLNHTRQTTTCRRREAGIPPRLVVDTIDALATVRDPEALQQLRLHGVGRFKAYGCGLLTAVPVA